MSERRERAPAGPPGGPFPLRLILTYDDLIEALRAVKAWKGMSFDDINEISGLADRLESKVLSPAAGNVRKRWMGPISFPCIMEALGVRLLLIQAPGKSIDAHANGSDLDSGSAVTRQRDTESGRANVLHLAR